MTQDPQNNYDNDIPLAAQHDDAGDEFDGLETGAKRSSKTLLIALGAVVLVAGAAFLTFEIFMNAPDDVPARPIAVAETAPQSMPGTETTPDAAMMPPGTETAATDTTMAQAPMPTDPTTANTNVDPSLTPAAGTADPNATTVPADPNAAVAQATTPMTDPVPNAPVVDPAASVPAASPTTEGTVPPAPPVAAPEPVTPAPTVDPAPAVEMPASVPPAAAALPTPPVEQLKPIDPGAVVDKAATPAAPLPIGAPQAPSPQKVADTMHAVNDILGADVATQANTASNAVNVAKTDATIAKQVEVTPRAKQVIVVKKGYSAQSPQAVVAAGDRVLQAGQYGDAVTIYDRQLKKNPSDPLALAGKALALQKAGRDTEAMSAYQRLLDLNPRDLDALTNYLGLLQKQNPSQALSRLQSLNQQYPENAAVAGQLGTTYAGMMDTPNALRQFQRAAALDATNPIYPFNMGVLYDRLGTSEKARDAYRQALILARDNPDRAGGVPLEAIRGRLGSLSY